MKFGRSTFIVFIACLFFGSPVLAATIIQTSFQSGPPLFDPEIVDGYKHLYKSQQAGDDYEPVTGTVAFAITDVDIPGNFEIPVALRRWIPQENLYTNGVTFGWSWDIPVIRGYFMGQAISDGRSVAHLGSGGWGAGKHCSQTVPDMGEGRTKGHVYVWNAEKSHGFQAYTYWEGKKLHIPGEVSEAFLEKTGPNGELQQVTKANYVVANCIENPNGMEGFLVIGPDGTRYTFNDFKTYRNSNELPSPQHSILRKYTRLILISNVVDRFGNRVNYHYDDDKNLTKIEASDGRLIAIKYQSYMAGTEFGQQIPQYIPSEVTANNKRWVYEYEQTTSTDLGGCLTNKGWKTCWSLSGQGGTIPYLRRVTLPNGSSWEYDENLYYLKIDPTKPSQISNFNPSGYHQEGGCYVAEAFRDLLVTTVKSPGGRITEYSFKGIYNGRSRVVMESYDDAIRDGSTSRSVKIARNLNCTVSKSLVAKKVTGPNMGEQIWRYQYSENRGTYLQNGQIVGHGGPYGVDAGAGGILPSTVKTSPNDFRSTTIIGPDSKVVHYVDRKFQSPTESQVVASDYYDPSSDQLLKRSESKHRLDVYVGKFWFIPPTHNYGGPGMLSLNANSMQYRINLAETTTQIYLEGGTDAYTTFYQDYDDLGFSAKTVESNNFSTRQRYTKQGYLHDRARWVLGLPTTTQISASDSAYTTVSEITYHETASTGKYTGWYLPYEFKPYGTWLRRYPEYHTAQTEPTALGQLRKLELNQKLTTASGTASSNFRQQVLTGYKRGKPQNVSMFNRYNDTSTMSFSRTINDDGWTTSITDLNGNKAFYNYDGVGRLTALDLPEPWSDTFIEWYDNTTTGSQRTATRCKLNSTRNACNAGTEVFESIADFDGFYRIVATVDRDLNNNIERHKNFAYDASHNVIFESYPAEYAGELDGTTRVFDALDREIENTVTGGGTVTTEYLAGNKQKVTNARGQATTTTYLAYGAPDYSQALSIQSPEGVTTTHTINLFGDITAITQTGPGKNGVGTVTQTERRAYDGQHKLCKVVRADVGTTVMSNNLLGEVQWQASGVTGGTNADCSSNVTDAQKVTLKYDNLGDLRQILYSSSAPDAAPNITYTRDNNGNVKTLQAGNVTQTYTYNALGLLEDERLQVDSKNYFIDYTYDGAGQLRSLQYPAGDVVTFAPNAFGEATQAARQARTGRSAFTYASSAFYYPNGMVNTFNYGNGLAHKTVLNDRQIPQAITDGRVGFTALHYEYSYDDNLNVTSIIDRINSSYSLTNLAYDGLDRLKTTVGNNGMGNSTVKYDGLGNITYYASKNSVLDYTYNTTNNRLTSVAGSGSAGKNYSFGYDTRGNVTGNGTRTVIYNLANQMTASGSNSYLYDGHNRRVKQTDSKGTSYSLYSQSGQLLYRETAAGGVNYIYLGKKLIAKDGVSPENNARQHYRPFGSSIEGESDDVGYTGHKFDKDLGLSYMQARYYDPVIGRFYSNDPVGAFEHFKAGNTIHGFGRYTYANNNPSKYNDPTGEIAWLAVPVLVGVATGALESYAEQKLSGKEVNSMEVVKSALKGGAVGALVGIGGAVKLASMGKTMADINKAAHSAAALKGMGGASAAAVAVGAVSGAMENEGGAVDAGPGEPAASPAAPASSQTASPQPAELPKGQECPEAPGDC